MQHIGKQLQSSQASGSEQRPPLFTARGDLEQENNSLRSELQRASELHQEAANKENSRQAEAQHLQRQLHQLKIESQKSASGDPGGSQGTAMADVATAPKEEPTEDTAALGDLGDEEMAPESGSTKTIFPSTKL